MNIIHNYKWVSPLIRCTYSFIFDFVYIHDMALSLVNFCVNNAHFLTHFMDRVVHVYGFMTAASSYFTGMFASEN